VVDPVISGRRAAVEDGAHGLGQGRCIHGAWRLRRLNGSASKSRGTEDAVLGEPSTTHYLPAGLPHPFTLHFTGKTSSRILQSRKGRRERGKRVGVVLENPL
jgi:hypothetical protein